MDTASRSEFIEALRKVAAVLEANPSLPVPYFGTQVVRCDSVDEFRAIVEAYGGRWNKESTDDSFQMTCQLHPNLSIMAYASHEKVCERVVIETKHVPKKVIPSHYEPEKVIAAHDEEVVKWVCPPVLAGERPVSYSDDYVSEGSAATETEQAVDRVLASSGAAEILKDEDIPF